MKEGKRGREGGREEGGSERRKEREGGREIKEGGGLTGVHWCGVWHQLHLLCL